MLKGSREPLFWALSASLIALAWGLMTPVWQGPDEPSHYAMVQWLAHHRSMPVFREEFGFSDELRASLVANDFERIRFHPEERVRAWASIPTARDLARSASQNDSEVGNAAATYPPLYYVPAAAVELAASPLDIAIRLRLARLVNLAWAFAFGWFTFKASNRALPDSHSAARVLAAIVLLWPQGAFMSGVVSPDIALAAVYAWTLDTALRLLDEGHIAYPVRCGIIAGAALLLKQTAGWAPVSLAAVAFIQAVRSSPQARLRCLRELALFFLATSLVAAPWLLFCRATYGSLNPWTFKAETHLAFLDAVRTYFTLTTPSAQFGQFLGRFGWLDTRIPRPLEAAVAVACAIGLIHSVGTQFRNPRWWIAVLVGLGGVAFTAVGLISSGMASGFLFAPIGRYHAAFIAAIATAIAMGPVSRGGAITERLPLRVTSILALLTMHLYTVLFVLMPRYYAGFGA